MKRLLAALLLTLLPSTCYAAIAFDVVNIGAAGTGNLSWTHTPSGTPRGVLILCAVFSSTANEIGAGSNVTYGGVATTIVSGSPVIKSSGETGSVYGYFLGASVPTGAQTVSVTVSGASTKRCSSITVTASTDTSVEDTDTISSDSLDDPGGTLTTTVDTFIAAVMIFGDVTLGNVAPIAGYTDPLESNPCCAELISLIRRTSIASSGSVSYGWTTSAADDTIAIAVAIREGVAGSVGSPGVGWAIGGFPH